MPDKGGDKVNLVIHGNDDDDSVVSIKSISNRDIDEIPVIMQGNLGDEDMSAMQM